MTYITKDGTPEDIMNPKEECKIVGRYDEKGALTKMLEHDEADKLHSKAKDSSCAKVLAAGLGMSAVAMAQQYYGINSVYGSSVPSERNTKNPDFCPNVKVHMKNRKKRKLVKKSRRANRKK